MTIGAFSSGLAGIQRTNSTTFINTASDAVRSPGVLPPRGWSLPPIAANALANNINNYSTSLTYSSSQGLYFAYPCSPLRVHKRRSNTEWVSFKLIGGNTAATVDYVACFPDGTVSFLPNNLSGAWLLYPNNWIDYQSSGITAPSGANITSNNFAYNSNTLVCVFTNRTANTTTFYYSTTKGATWVQASQVQGGLDVTRLRWVPERNTYFAIVSANQTTSLTASMYTSPDGINWSQISQSGTVGGTQPAFSYNIVGFVGRTVTFYPRINKYIGFRGVSTVQQQMYSSDDLSTWTYSGIPVYPNYGNVNAVPIGTLFHPGANCLIASANVEGRGNLIRSDDGINWYTSVGYPDANSSTGGLIPDKINALQIIQNTNEAFYIMGFSEGFSGNSNFLAFSGTSDRNFNLVGVNVPVRDIQSGSGWVIVQTPNGIIEANASGTKNYIRPPNVSTTTGTVITIDGTFTYQITTVSTFDISLGTDGRIYSYAGNGVSTRVVNSGNTWSRSFSIQGPSFPNARDNLNGWWVVTASLRSTYLKSINKFALFGTFVTSPTQNYSSATFTYRNVLILTNDGVNFTYRTINTITPLTGTTTQFQGFYITEIDSVGSSLQAVVATTANNSTFLTYSTDEGVTWSSLVDQSTRPLGNSANWTTRDYLPFPPTNQYFRWKRQTPTANNNFQNPWKLERTSHDGTVVTAEDVVFTNHSNTGGFQGLAIASNITYDESANLLILFTGLGFDANRGPYGDAYYAPYGEMFEVLTSSNGSHWTGRGTISEAIQWIKNYTTNDALYIFNSNGMIRGI